LHRQSGSSDDLARWDPVMRSLRDGVPVCEPGQIDFTGSDGSQLDLHRSFRLDDDPSHVGRFLSQTGYLHLRSVFSDEEMEAVSDELDGAISSAERDDGQSWWARTDEGWYPSRILGFNRKSPTLRELLKSDRFQTIPSFLDDLLVQADVDESDMAEGLLKKLDVRDGISDVTWHKDCGPGGHTYGCSGLTVGIQLTAADRNSGELGVMAGSNRANIPGLYPVSDFGLERMPLSTSRGDCTVHCSCTMHMSRPPVSAERRVVYTGFSLAPFAEDMATRLTEAERRRERNSLQDVVGKATARDRHQEIPLD
jgi:phytanoyl-CoA dioxygenase PhyH